MVPTALTHSVTGRYVFGNGEGWEQDELCEALLFQPKMTKQTSIDGRIKAMTPGLYITCWSDVVYNKIPA